MQDYSSKLEMGKKADLIELLKQTPYQDQICLKTERALSELELTNIHYYSAEDFV